MAPCPVRESGSISNKALLELEKSLSALEKQLLVCTDGEHVVNKRSPKRTKPPTIRPMPESTVLKRIKSFLPEMDRANCKLISDIKVSTRKGSTEPFIKTEEFPQNTFDQSRSFRAPPKDQGVEKFNIEAITNAEEKYVEMDLAVGVADLYTPEAVAAAELAASGQGLVACEKSSCDSDSEGDDRPNYNDKPHRKRIKIEML